MIRHVIPLLALLLLPGASAAGPASSAGELRWRSFDAGLREARTARRPVVVDVFTDWCRYCKLMDREVYSRADVREYLSKRFIPVRLDAEGREAATYEGRAYTGRTLAQRFRVNGYPTTIFLRSDGGYLVNVPGYVPADRFLLLLRYVGEGAMERGEDFDAFARRTADTGR
jgi:thioredoxin-related protein